jgi:Flp pilus assembly protein TadB
MSDTKAKGVKCVKRQRSGSRPIPGKEGKMLWAIFVVLLILWFLGLVSGYTVGGFVHVLLVIAVIVLVVRLVQGRRAV